MTTTDHYQFLKQLSAVFDGTLAEPGCAEVAGHLAANDEALALYLEFVALDIQLAALAISGEAPPAAAIAPPAAEAPKTTLQVATGAEELPTAVSLPGPHGWLRRISTSYTASALAAILLVATIFYGTFIGISWNIRDARVRAVADRQGGVRDRAIPERGIAQITRADDVQWLSANEAAAIEPGRQFELNSGEVHLSLKQGASVVVQGPADWTVLDDNRVRLNRGTLLANVPTQAIGFTVETPTAHIIDQGTQFTVTVDAASETQIQVQRGRVDVARRLPTSWPISKSH